MRSNSFAVHIIYACSSLTSTSYVVQICTTTHAGGLALSPFAIASLTYAQFPWTEAGMEAT